MGVSCMFVLLLGHEGNRAQIDDKYKWNLEDIFADIAAWRAAKEKVTREIPGIRAFAGKLGTSAGVLADVLEMLSRMEKELSTLYVYASLTSDQDTRVSEPQGMQQEMEQLFAEFGAQAAYVEPEVLRIGEAAI